MKKKNRIKNENKIKTWKKVTIIVVSVLLAVILALVGVGLGFLGKIERKDRDDFEMLSSIDEERNSDEYGENLDVELLDGEIKHDPNIKNILLIGVDANSGGYGRSDVMMLISIDSKSKTIKQTSFLRDTYLSIPGKEDNRLNAAYAYGGPGLLIETIEQNYKIKIDNYAKVDFTSFVDVVDVLGGIEIELTQAEAEHLNNPRNSWKYSAGVNTLTKEDALRYCRIRAIDSDFGRTNRQRTFVQAVINKFKDADLSQIISIANTVAPMIQTDMSNADILGWVTKAPELMSWTIEELYLPFEGAYESKMIRGMSVLVPDIEVCKEKLWEFIYGI